MSPKLDFPHYYICPICTHPTLVSDPKLGAQQCERCGHNRASYEARSPELALIFSITALIFYIPANIFPFMSIDLYGNQNSSTIWSGIKTLTADGSWLIALIVFLASMVIPFLKLAILFYLSLTAKNSAHSRLKTRLYHFVEVVGRWSMLDIFLLAVLVAIMKLGPWTHVEPGIGSGLFALVVIFTMLASAYFDPQLLWNESYENISESEN